MTTKKTIYFLLPSLVAGDLDGGSEKVVLTLIKNIDKTKFQPRLILFKKEGDCSAVLGEIEYLNLKAANLFQGVIKLWLLLWRQAPDIFFSSMGPYNALLAPWLLVFRKIKKIARETNIPSMMHRLKINAGRREYYLIKIFYKLFYNFFDVIVAQSDDMRRDLIKNYRIAPQKIVKINNPIDLSEDKINSIATTELFAKDKINIVSVGRLVPQKGYDILINKVAELASDDYCFYILGHGCEEKSLRQLIDQKQLTEKVKLLGYTTNPYPYLKKADLFLLPSRMEGFPNVLLEALICGLPVIANNCPGGINEIVIPGFNGVVVDLATEPDFNKIIREALQLRVNQVQIAADVKKRFGLATIIEQYAAVFE